MALLGRAQFSVGNDLIDADHKYLLEIINKAELSLKANNRVELTAVLAELAHYGAIHFEVKSWWPKR
jgi:hemerythrin